MAGSKHMIPALCCLSLLCFSSSAIADYDYFQFSLLWPGGYCHDWYGSECCLPTTADVVMPALDFFVNGLKAYNSITGECVTNCNSGSKLYDNAVADLITNLYKYWSDVDCPCNDGVDQWRDAWYTYGTCTKFDQKTYFGKALNLISKLNLLSHLKNQGIEPSETTLYKLSDIQDALTAELGGPAIIECKKTWSPHNHTMQKNMIVKFTFCIHSDGKTRISCPFSVTSNCDEKVIFYPFTYDMLEGYDDSRAQLIKLPFVELKGM